MVHFLKSILKRDSYLYRLLSFLYNYRRIYWKPPVAESLQELIDIYLQTKKQVSFIQVGSNDGISNDPLHKYIVGGNWSGFCIEPLPENVKHLKQNYTAFPQVQIIEAAVGDDGERSIYTINPSKANQLGIDIPEWHSQLASFDRDLVVSDIRGVNKYEILDEVSVQTISFSTIIGQNKIQKLDLLHIDTEGADWLIL